MKPMSLIAGAVFAVVIAASTVQAATYRIDDSATIPHASSATMKWQQSVAGRRGTDNLASGGTSVQVRLNLAPWLNRTGRIYLVLPEQPDGSVAVQWSTQGRLLPGQLVSGQRTLVYSGPIQSPVLAEKLALQFETDGRSLKAVRRLNFHFEIDVD